MCGSTKFSVQLDSEGSLRSHNITAPREFDSYVLQLNAHIETFNTLFEDRESNNMVPKLPAESGKKQVFKISNMFFWGV